MIHQDNSWPIHARKAALLAGLAMAAIATTAAAQEGQPPADERGKVESIIVTASKRGAAQNVQKINAAITALGIQQLSDSNFSDLQSLTYNMPNVQLDGMGTTPGYQNFSFRGLGINSSIVTIEPTVGVFVDGVYQGVNAGQVFDNFDLEGVEVLRGPQGVLFGRNVTAGAVLLNTAKPQFTTHVRGGLSVESGPNYIADASVTGALIDNLLAAKLAVFYNKDTGYFTNKLDNSQFGKQEEVIVRPAFLLRPAAGAEIVLRGEHGHIYGADSGVAAQNHALYSRDSFDFLAVEKGYNHANWNSVTAETNVNVGFGNGKITNVTGWREFQQKTKLDVDGTINKSFVATPFTKQNQFSSELRYAGTFGPAAITVGAFYFQQHIFHIEQRDLGATSIAGGGDYRHHQWALFGNSDYKLTSRLTLNAGLRYSHEFKRLHGSLFRAGGCDLDSLTCAYTFPDQPSTYPSYSGPDARGWNSLSAKVGLQYQPGDATQIYAYWARSFRSGGYNIRQAAVATSPGPFDQERQDTFEAGLKQDFADRRGRVNIAAFHNYLHNIQREVNLPVVGLGIAQDIVNAGNVEIYGAEFEGQFNITPALRISAQAGYTHGKYLDVFYDLNGDGVINAKDYALKLPRLSPWSYGVSLRYNDMIGRHEVTANVSVNHRDASFYDDKNAGFLNAMDQVDAKLTVRPGKGPVSISIYGKNLLNRASYGGDTQLPDVAGFGGDGAGPRAAPTFSPLAKGRVIGGSIRVDF